MFYIPPFKDNFQKELLKVKIKLLQTKLKLYKEHIPKEKQEEIQKTINKIKSKLWL